MSVNKGFGSESGSAFLESLDPDPHMNLFSCLEKCLEKNTKIIFPVYSLKLSLGSVSGFALDFKTLDPDPHEMDADPKPCNKL